MDIRAARSARPVARPASWASARSGGRLRAGRPGGRSPSARDGPSLLVDENERSGSVAAGHGSNAARITPATPAGAGRPGDDHQGRLLPRASAAHLGVRSRDSDSDWISAPGTRRTLRRIRMAITTRSPGARPPRFPRTSTRLLDDEERAIRDTVRAVRRASASCPRSPSGSSGRPCRESSRKEMAARAARHAPRRLRVAGRERGRVRARVPRARSRRLGVRSFVSVQGSLAMFPIWRWGSEEQKQEWLPRMARGRGDRMLRPDRAGLRHRPRRDAHHARRDGSDWILNGTKMWITNGSIADVAVVWARTEEDGHARLPRARRTCPGSALRRSRRRSRCAPR